jgi:hypothetical protein
MCGRKLLESNSSMLDVVAVVFLLADKCPASNSLPIPSACPGSSTNYAPARP